jgi:hypothetical protein
MQYLILCEILELSTGTVAIGHGISEVGHTGQWNCKDGLHPWNETGYFGDT